VGSLSERKILRMAMAAVFAFACILTRADAHDIYSNVREFNDPNKMICCGGGEHVGDCEAVEYRVIPDEQGGGALFLTKRYGGKWVHIAKDKIAWDKVKGGEAFEAHWCGKPYAHMGEFRPDKGDPLQPDPDFFTYCAFLQPGGV
jgi:hypothetical protein